jgi:hypothetical protein
VSWQRRNRRAVLFVAGQGPALLHELADDGELLHHVRAVPPACVGTLTNCNALNMLLPKQEDARVMPDSLGKQVMRKKFYRDFDL